MLRDRDMTIGEVAENFDMTRAAIKKPLAVLSDGGLITVWVHGRERINSLNPDGIQLVIDWLRFFDAFWDQRLAALTSEIEMEKP